MSCYLEDDIEILGDDSVDIVLVGEVRFVPRNDITQICLHA